MRSKHLQQPSRSPASVKGLVAALACIIWLGACDSPVVTGNGDNYQIGRKPESFSASYQWRGGDPNAVVALDRRGKTVQRFSLEPFEHQLSLRLPLPYERQSVAASADGAYFVTLAAAEYAILKANGESLTNPVPLLGDILSVAYDPWHHFLVLTDEFQTMALLTLSAGGDVLASWKGGNRFPGDKLVRAGTVLADGRLLLSLGATTLALIDIPATVAAQAWQYTSFEVADATDMKWITTVPDQANIVMVIDGDRILSVNVADHAVVDQKALAVGTLASYSRDYIPHVVAPAVETAATHDVTSINVNGKLVTSQIRGSDRQIVQTLLDASGVLTLVYDPDTARSSAYEDPYYRRQTIYRFRLSDNAGLDKAEIDEDVNLALTPNHLFLLYPSTLGKAARRGFVPHQPDEVVEGYNFELFRDSYRQAHTD